MNKTNSFSRRMHRLFHNLFAAGLTALTFSHAVMADDTEVFLGSQSFTDPDAVRPNVMFILDSSTSMYDPSGTPGLSRIDAMKAALIEILSTVNNINLGLMTFNTRGGPVRYPIAPVDARIEDVEDTGFDVISSVVAASDDAEEVTDALFHNGDVDLGSNSLHVTLKPDVATIPPAQNIAVAYGEDDAYEEYPGGVVTLAGTELFVQADHETGMLFRNVDVPRQATITKATLTLTFDPDGVEDSLGGLSEYDPASAMITVQDSSGAPPFTTGLEDISSRPRTLKTHFWSNIASVNSVATVETTNFAALVQDIVDRPDWSRSNNSLALFIIGITGFREYAANEQGASLAPVLNIEYTEDEGDVRQLIGLRFQDVRIPQGADIEEAFVGFTATANSSSPIDIDIYGEKVANSATFAATSQNLSSRTLTGAKADWVLNASPGHAWVADERYLTSDIAAVVEEIVQQDSWCGGNSLTIFLDPQSDSARRFLAYEGVSSNLVAAPSLYVDFNTDPSLVSANYTGCVATDVSVRISNGKDDVEERAEGKGTGKVSRGSDDIDMVRHIPTNGTQYDQKIGLRFRNVDVMKNAAISRAFLEFTARTSNRNTSGSANVKIYGHDVNNSGGFNKSKNQVTNRLNKKTTASVNWTITEDWEDEKKYQVEVTDIVQEITSRSGWSAKNAMTFLMEPGNGRRAFYSYNKNVAKAARLIIQTQTNVPGQQIEGQTVRQRLIQEVQELHLVQGTPIVDTYMEAIRYYRGDAVGWGLQRGGQQSADRYGRVSYPFSYTGGTVDRDPDCTDANLNSSDCRYEHIDGGPDYKSPITDPCQANYIIVLSDGSQNTFHGEAAIESFLGKNCDSNNGGADCGKKLATLISTTDQSPDAGGGHPGIQTIKTYTIGFNFTSGFLEDLAGTPGEGPVGPGDPDPDNDGIKGSYGHGEYLEASSAADLVEVFNKFLSQISSDPTTFVAPTLTLNAFNQLFNSNEIYVSLFKPEQSATWSGNLKKYWLCTVDDVAGSTGSDCSVVNQILDDTGEPATENGQIREGATSVWSEFGDGNAVREGGAGGVVEEMEHSNRRLFTYTASGAPSNVPLSSHPLTLTNKMNIKPYLGVVDSEVDDLIEWIRGRDVDDENGDSQTTDTRWVFGDPLHSSAVPISFGIDSSPPAGSNPQGEAIVKLVVGTNDGAVRMINSFNGKEEWAFIPQEMLGIQAGLRQDQPGADHIYGMDGSPAIWVHDADLNGVISPTNSNDFARVFIGQRRGGDNYYALDVSPGTGIGNVENAASITPEFMWRIEGGGGDFVQLGQTWSKPQHTVIQETVSGQVKSRDVVIFGGGYDTSNDRQSTGNDGYGPAAVGNAIYIVDALTGERLWWASSDINATVTVPDMVYAIPSNIRLMDMDGNGATDRLMVGDLGGQIWRVDLLSTFQKDSKAGTVVGKFAELSDNGITPVASAQRRFMFRPSVALINDPAHATAARYVAVAIASGNRSDPLYKGVLDRAYALRDYQVGPLAATASGLADSAVYKTIKLNDGSLVDATGFETTANISALSADGKKGWYIDLKGPGGVLQGEKAIVESKIIIPTNPKLPPLFTFTTFSPATSNSTTTCGVDLGTNLIYAVNLLNSEGTSIFDEDPTKKKRSVVNNTSGISPEVIVITQEGQGGSSIMGGTGDPIDVDLGEGFVPIYWVE